MCSMLFVACEKDSDDNSASTGSDNTTDMAVTGDVSNITSNAATVKGYVLFDQNYILLIEDFGVEYANNERFSNAARIQVNGYTGREFTLSIGGLSPNTTYYYRTYAHQVSGLYNYGITLSFKTNSLGLVVSNISYTKADIRTNENSEDQYSIYLSTNKDSNFKVYKTYGDYSYATDSYEVIHKFYAGWNSVTLSGLKPGTTYYCYISSSRCNSETVSFTTKSLDLSGVKVESKYISTYTSYTNWYGQKVDLSWLGGEYEYTFTSNLGSGYKYGVIATDDVVDDLDMCKRSENVSDFCYYSNSTSSPYKLSISPFSYTPEASEISSRIAFYLDLIEEGWATKTDYEELEELYREIEQYRVERTHQSFIEKDGERIYIE